MSGQPSHAHRRLGKGRGCYRIFGAAQIQQDCERARVSDEKSKCPMLDLMDEASGAGKIDEQRTLDQARDQQRFNRQKSNDDEQARKQAVS